MGTEPSNSARSLDAGNFAMSCLSVRMADLRNAPPPDDAWLARGLKVEQAV